jgi:hypothetical protein
MIAEYTVDTARPPTEVYAFLIDQDNWAALDPTLLDVSPRGEVVVGMAGTMRRRVNGLRVTDTWIVTALEPSSRLAMRVRGPGYEVTETMTLEAIPQGTRVTVVDVLEPTSLGGRLFVAVSGPFIRRDLKARFERLRSLLEAASAT